MLCCVLGYGGPPAWLTTVSPARWTPFPYRPMHVWPVWCAPACLQSVYGHVVAVAVVLFARGRVSRLLVGLFGVGSLAQSYFLRVGALLVAVLVGASCVGPARYIFTVRRLPTVEEKSNDKGCDRCKKLLKFGALFPAPPWQRYMHNTSSGTLQCSVAVLPALPVPFICTPPVGGKVIHMRSQHHQQRIIFRIPHPCTPVILQPYTNNRHNALHKSFTPLQRRIH